MKSKIVATIGPKSNNIEMLKKLYDAGMRVARLNGSHSNLIWHQHAIDLIRNVLPSVPIIFDIPGRKIRTLSLKHEPSFSTDEIIIITTDESHDGSEKIPVNYRQLADDLQIGSSILADDGTLRFTVVKIEGSDIHCRAEVNGVLRSRKGINVPFVKLKTPLVTEKDISMIEFCKNNKIDYIGLSFVESAEHIKAIRKILNHPWPKIVAKVENQAGIDNLDDIVTEADAIMVDRGDLSVETNLEAVAILQKKILVTAQKFGIPVIIATEILHTMIENPFPTKAEISDITNAVLDGASATMLSGETAMGEYGVEAVSLMQKVANITVDFFQATNKQSTSDSIPRAIEEAARLLCSTLPITKVVVITQSGYAARILASKHLAQPILAVTNDPVAARSFNLLYGTEGIYVDIPFSQMSTDHIACCLKELWVTNSIIDSDYILVVAVAYPKPGNLMNLLQTHSVYDLRCSLKWSMDHEISISSQGSKTLVTEY